MLRPLFRTLGIVAVCCAAMAGAARADELADINRLYAGGQTQEAFAQLDQLLVQRPRDAQLRFLKGVLLNRSQRSDEAEAVFRQLTVDYPDMPEPYNNLAVVHAAHGDYDRARNELEAALRANPSYAVAQHNLGDVYVQLARLSYERALRLEPSNTAVGPKLALLQQIIKPINAGPAPGTASSTPKVSP